ncbi:hypothetical protein L249_0302, partial [Ophiocordyceps polyrhachis-furcata BCC 54312]
TCWHCVAGREKKRNRIVAEAQASDRKQIHMTLALRPLFLRKQESFESSFFLSQLPLSQKTSFRLRCTLEQKEEKARAAKPTVALIAQPPLPPLFPAAAVSSASRVEPS